jgi:zinc protease
VPLADSIDAARTAMLATLDEVKTKPITQAEVDRVKAKALKDVDELLNDPTKLGVALSESIALGDWRLFFQQRDRWRSLTAADVQRVAVEYLKPANLTLGEYIPDAKPDRAPDVGPVDVAAALKDYKGDAQVAAGETFDPTPANLEARTKRYTLPNGMKLALLPKKTRGETVQFQLRLHYGDEKSLLGTPPAGSLAAAMLERGTTKRDRQAYEDALDKLRAKVAIGGSETGISASGETVRAHAADVLRLVAEALREPSFPANEFDKLKRERITRLEQQKTDPQAIAGRVLARHDNPYPKGDVRYMPTFDEDLASLNAATLDDAKAFYRRFVGGAHGELAIVGDFDPEAMRSLANELLGSWATPAPYARVPDPYRPTTPTALRIETPDKANAVLMGQLALPMNDASTDYAAMLVANQILGASPESRVTDRVREKEGLSYGAGVAFRPASIDENSSLLAYAIFAPQNLERVRKGIGEELVRAVKDGYTPKEVDDAKKAVMQERRIARTRDGSLAGGLTSQAFLGRTWDYTAKVDAAIESLTLDQVNAALRKYVRPDQFAYTFAGDFAKAK